MGKPVLIILGGTDCSSFPSISYGNFNKKLLGWFTCQSLKMATHLAPVAESLVDVEYSYTDKDFGRQGYKNFCSKTKTPYTVVHLGYDDSKFFCSVNKQHNTLLCVAQLNKPNYYRKGIDLIFEIAPSFPACHFDIVGNTDEMKYDHIPSNVKLLPFVPYEQLKDLYSQHEFYLQLSIMEGFPSALCEAMLCECIPITSGVGAMPMIIGNSGFILERKNLSELKNLLEKAVSSDRKTMGMQARQRIADKFPLKEREKLIELAKSLIKS